jgi:16S rRNA (guanine527-N7)-methyltransferase
MSRPPERADLRGHDRAQAEPLLSVSRETQERLATFVALLEKWRTVTNLISEATISTVWTRHIADCTQILVLAPGATRWVDLGTGAGFPGLVLAIQLADVPGAVVHCIESDKRKCAFLREAVRATGASAVIHAARVEDIAPDMGPVDVVTARAFAPLPKVLKLAKVWLADGATGVFPRGRSAIDQIAVAVDPSIYWTEIVESVVDPHAAILKIGMK